MKRSRSVKIILSIMVISLVVLFMSYVTDTSANGSQPQFKTVEVKHFTQADGLGVPQDFVNSFYDGLRENLQKMKIAGQIVDEGATVPNADAADSAVVEGKITGYKKGFGGFVSSEIKLYRRSDHTLIKTITLDAPFKLSYGNNDEKAGGFIGRAAAYEIKKALGGN
jgi:hypothetical protein